MQVCNKLEDGLEFVASLFRVRRKEVVVMQYESDQSEMYRACLEEVVESGLIPQARWGRDI
jgi:hypothetical protein